MKSQTHAPFFPRCQNADIVGSNNNKKSLQRIKQKSSSSNNNSNHNVPMHRSNGSSGKYEWDQHRRDLDCSSDGNKILRHVIHLMSSP